MNIFRILTTVALVLGVATGEWQPESHEIHSGAIPSSAPLKQNLLDSYGKLPLTFVPNAGQTDAQVRFVAQTSGANFYFTSTEAVFAFVNEKKRYALRLTFLGANPSTELVGSQAGVGKVNYLFGNDPARWRTGLPTYGEVVYRDLWPGIDLAFRGENGELKYEFRLAPGADPNHIRLAYRGAKRLSLDRDGDLKIHTSLGVLSDSRPTTYQITAGARIPVASRYRLVNNSYGFNSYGFTLSAHDPTLPLVIDPGLAYSTFLGVNADAGLGIAVDAAGNAYVTGETGASDFPTTVGAFDETFNGGTTLGRGDVFVTKLNPSGTALEYSTYLGGSANEVGTGIAVDAAGNAYVTGSTLSSNFPTSTGAFDTSYNGGLDAFVTKLDATGSFLAYSTYLGGSAPGLPCSPSCPDDAGAGIAVDSAGNAYVTGGTRSRDFPTTPGAFDTSYTPGAGSHVFVTKLDPTGSALMYSTYLGGDSIEEGAAISVDNAGNAYVTGVTGSNAFPTTAGAFDTTRNGGQDAFLTKVNADGNALVYSTFLGGSLIDQGDGITIDANGNAYVMGFSNSIDFPTTPGAFDTTLTGLDDAFVAKLNTDGSDLVYSTYLGGSGREICNYFGRGLISRFCWGIGVDANGSAYVTGGTTSADFPTTAGAFDTTYNGGTCNVCGDVFVTKLNAMGSAALYSTYLGGPENESGRAIAVDTSNGVYVTGSTTSTNFPTTAGAFQPIGGQFLGDAFVLRLSNQPPSAADDTATTDEDIAATISLVANDVDPDGDPLLVSDVTQGANGSVVINPDNSVTYSPAANFNGTDTFTYTITDTWGETSTANVMITINAINDPPMAEAASVSTDEDLSVLINLVATDVDSSGLTLAIVSEPANGTLSPISDGNVNYLPNPNFNGSDSFTFKANDGEADSIVGTVSITIAAVNDSPSASDDSYSTPANTPLVVTAPGVLANDTDIEGDVLSAVLVTNVSSGTLSLAMDGSFTYTPNLNFSGGDAFTYHAFDGGANSNVVTVQITAAPPPPINCKQEGPCFVFEYLGYNTDANGQTTISFSVTNKCKNAVRMVAIGTDSFTRVAPADGSIYNGVLGSYDVGWTRPSGNPGFVSIKFEPLSKNFKNGAADVFSIGVTNFNPNTTVQVKGVGAMQETFSFLLSQTSCSSTVGLKKEPLGGFVEWLSRITF